MSSQNLKYDCITMDILGKHEDLTLKICYKLNKIDFLHNSEEVLQDQCEELKKLENIF